MKNLLLRSLFVCAVVFVIRLSGQAQEHSRGSSVVSGAGNIAVVVVKSATKSAWVAAKFSAKHVVRPVAKTMLLKVPAYVVKRALPAAGKLGLVYLKTKLP